MEISINPSDSARGERGPQAIPPASGLLVAVPTAKIRTLILAFLAIGHLSSAHAADIEALLLLQHTSDLLRGPPFNNDSESQHDYLAPIGITITAGVRKAWELDLTHGVKFINRGKRETGSQLAVRFYPGRLRREN
jgi:hypothetical protein